MSQEPDTFNESVVWLGGDRVGVLELRKAMSFHIAARRWRSPSTILECEDQQPLNYPVPARFVSISSSGQLDNRAPIQQERRYIRLG